MPGRGRPFTAGFDPRRKLDGTRKPRLSDVLPARDLIRKDREANLKALQDLRDNPDTPPTVRAEIGIKLLEFDAGRPGVAAPPADEPTTEDGEDTATLLALPTKESA